MHFIPAYFPSITYMANLVQQPVVFCVHSHYQKQTYRNRCNIYGANGKLSLSVPIEHRKTGEHQKDHDVMIKEQEDWKKNHWRSLESAYRSSPFFEFYEDELAEVFFTKKEKLMDFNIALMRCVFDWLSFEDQSIFSERFIPLAAEEERLIIAKKSQPLTIPAYTQVFESKHGFISDLSVLDLIFNLGPESRTYLDHLIPTQTG